MGMAMAVKLALGLLLLGSVAGACLGPPPRRRASPGVRGGILACALAGYGLAAAALAGGALAAGTLTLALAGELVCAAGWLARGAAPPADDDDAGGGGGGDRGPKPPPGDWDAFERAFRRYAREHDRRPV
jgi:hypothetical protein